MVPKGRLTAMGLLLIRASAGTLAFVMPPTTTTTITRLQIPRPTTLSRVCGGGRGVGQVQHATSAATATITTTDGYSARHGSRGIRPTSLCCSAGGVGVVAISSAHNSQAMAAGDEEEGQGDDGPVARTAERAGLADIQPVLRKYLEVDSDGSVKKVA